MDQFLTIPLSKRELEKQKKESWRDNLYEIEGFIYDASLHSQAFHWWIDYYCDYWTQVYSPIDWYVMSSYNYSFCYELGKDLKSTWNHRCYLKEKLSYGLWYALQLYCPTRDLFLLYWHFSYLSSLVPYTPPKLTKDERWNDMWSCSWFALTRELREKIDQVPRAKKIRQWDYLWDVWLSWLYRGKELPTKEEVSDKPWNQIEYCDYMYTEPHLHLNVFSRNDDWSKASPFDPYGIYSRSEDYPTHERERELWDTHIMKLWEDWKVMFVDELFH